MLLYRTFPFRPEAGEGESGHPMYVHRPQGRSRLDNPHLYDAAYFGYTKEVAIGESFADLSEWSEQMFTMPGVGERVLGTYRIDDDLPLLDLDDANALAARSLRPTQVVSRNRSATKAWAKSIFNEQDPDGSRTWAGVRWWSYHRPQWTVIAIWTPMGESVPYSFVEADELTTSHPAVEDAAKTLGRPIR